jgi:hypothetical protein
MILSPSVLMITPKPPAQELSMNSVNRVAVLLYVYGPAKWRLYEYEYVRTDPESSLLACSSSAAAAAHPPFLCTRPSQ